MSAKASLTNKISIKIKNFFNKYPWQFWMIVISAIMVQLLLFKFKSVFHVDELSTLGVAFGDKEVLLFHHPDEFDNKLFTGKELYNQFMSAQGRYGRLWENLPLDHQMPLYFVLLNIFGSDFYTHFTILPAIWVNGLSLIGALWGFYALAMRLFNKQEIATISLIFFAFMPSVLSMEVFVRMYLLWMALSLWGTIYLIDYLEYEKKNSLIYVFLFISAQNLTHYYGLIFAFILALCGGSFLLFSKRYRQLVYFACTMIGTVIFTLAIYPKMIEVGYNSERGTEFWENIKLLFLNPKSIFREKLPYFYNSICGGGHTLLTELFLLISGCFLALRKKYISFKQCHLIIFLTSLVLGYGFCAAWIQPNMLSYQVRYFSPIIPLSALLGIYILVIWSNLLHINKNVFTFLLWLGAAIWGINAGMNTNNPFYFRGTRETEKLDNILKNTDIWWAMGGGWVYSYYIHNYADKVEKIDKIWSLADFENKNFIAFSNEEMASKKYAYALFPYQQGQAPEWVINWIKETTGRKAFYLFKIPYSPEYPISPAASVFLVAPY